MIDAIGETGLRFFGVMSASISHEIKNRIAIINEQAGLLEDLVKMAERGQPLDPARLHRLASSVMTQVAHANRIVGNMNGFSHSVDNLWQPVDLEDLLQRSVALFKRKADMACVRLALDPALEPASANTSPFLLTNLIWLCLEATMSTVAQETNITFGCKKTPAGVTVMLSADSTPKDLAQALQSNEIKGLAEALQAKLSLDPGGRQVALELPADIARAAAPCHSAESFIPAKKGEHHV